MTTTKIKPGAAGGPGRYVLAADDWWQSTPTEEDPSADVHRRRGDEVILDAAEAKHLWHAGALVVVGQPLPTRPRHITPIEVQLAHFHASRAAAAAVIDEQDRASNQRRRDTAAAIAAEQAQR